MTSRIARIEVIPIFSPASSANDLDGTADTVIVKIFDDDGRYGFGEADAPPAAVKSFLEMPTAHLWSRNASEILIGEDPLEIAAIWQKLYDGTFWPGRRGLGIHAISAIDIALHDLAGKQLGIPAYKLMGGARRDKLRPYCTIFPGLGTGPQYPRADVRNRPAVRHGPRVRLPGGEDGGAILRPRHRPRAGRPDS